jgi:hypothetical protein
MNMFNLYKPKPIIVVQTLCVFFACATAHAQEVADRELRLQDGSGADILTPDTLGIDQLVSDEEEKKLNAKAANVQETADEGIQIQVERSTGTSQVASKPGAIKVYSPWPAKPLAEAPEGWQYVPAPSEIEAYKQTVKLSSGNTIDLAITPFVLEPIRDGTKTIRIAEPGYDAALQYAQKNTLGTMLQKSTMELEENEKHAARAISLLQQLLSSLPQTK